LLPRSGARTPPRACCARCEQFPALRARRGASPLWLRDALDRRDADSLRRFCVPLRLCVPALARKFRPAAWPLRPGVASPLPPIAPALSSLFRRPGAVRPRPWPARAHASAAPLPSAALPLRRGRGPASRLLPLPVAPSDGARLRPLPQPGARPQRVRVPPRYGVLQPCGPPPWPQAQLDAFLQRPSALRACALRLRLGRGPAFQLPRLLVAHAPDVQLRLFQRRPWRPACGCVPRQSGVPLRAGVPPRLRPPSPSRPALWRRASSR